MNQAHYQDCEEEVVVHKGVQYISEESPGLQSDSSKVLKTALMIAPQALCRNKRKKDKQMIREGLLVFVFIFILSKSTL